LKHASPPKRYFASVAGLTSNSLQRTAHIFDGSPRWISFTSACHKTSNQRVKVATASNPL
jgi:hypothetical protein